MPRLLLVLAILSVSACAPATPPAPCDFDCYVQRGKEAQAAREEMDRYSSDLAYAVLVLGVALVMPFALSGFLVLRGD
ncbi:MAG: hypothetical protein AB7E32_10715 [Desulfovibrio sp.]